MRSFLALALAATASFPQTEAPASVPDNLVRVDAFVADARNRPLDTLTAADFELREDGTPQTIEAVRFIRADTEPRLVAIYLDEYHLSAASADRVREQLLRFVDRDLDARDLLVVLKPLDSLLTIRMEGRREAARDVIARFVGRKGNYDPSDSYERQYMGNAPAAIDPARVQITVSALNALTIHLGQASPDARKTLIVVSEGFEGTTGRLRLELPTIASLSQSANRSNVSVYALDPSDAGAGDEGSALGHVVSDTDGFWIRGRGAVESGLKRIATDLGGYYLIAYRSPGKTDNRFHAVQLGVKRPGANVRTRAGYWSASPDDLLRAEMLAAAKTPPAPKRLEPPLRVSRLIRPWFGVSRGADGHTRVTFVWEPTPGVPGERGRMAPTRLQFTAFGADSSEVFEGTVFPVGSSVVDGDASNRAVFEVPPGRVRVRMSIEDAGQQEIDSDVRDIAVSDLRAPVAIGTPEVLRVRSAREFRALEADPEAVPVASRVFSRIERLLVRVPAYAPDGDPAVSATLMSRLGQPIRTLAVTPPATPGGPSQVDLTLAGLASTDYQIEFRVKTPAGEARDSVSFRVTP